MPSLPPANLTHAVLDPRFVVSTVRLFGSEPLCAVQIEHPTHGLLSFVWPLAEVRKLHEALEVALTC
jgi:hypothetical protein